MLVISEPSGLQILAIVLVANDRQQEISKQKSNNFTCCFLFLLVLFDFDFGHGMQFRAIVRRDISARSGFRAITIENARHIRAIGVLQIRAIGFIILVLLEIMRA